MTKPCGCGPLLDPCASAAALRGKSAYEIWVDGQAPNADTSLEAFWQGLKGAIGNPGATGASIVSVSVETQNITE